MRRASADSIARWIGLTVGLAVAAALLTSWQVPAAGDTLGADVTLAATPPGELILRPAGALLQARGLTAGGAAARGRLELRNITPRRLRVRARLRPATGDLDGALRIEVAHRGRRLVGGSVGRLRGWSTRSVVLRPGETRRLDLRARIVPAARNYAGRNVDVALELRVRPVRR